MFSKSCEYGIRATVMIAQHSLNTERVSLKLIAKEIASPEPFTAKILQILSRNRIVASLKGPNGGFEMSESMLEKITLFHVVAAIDGEVMIHDCGLGLKVCNPKKPCPIHDQFMGIRTNLTDMLKETSIRDLALGLKDGSTFLKD
ncbi:Rrf2 family transcriptional regulator [Crocinitomix sp.]|nr:Rrf2 family transcriptional regulator [Crocinitomix sp.]